jgi:DNA-binding transcriptional MerR regulator
MLDIYRQHLYIDRVEKTTDSPHGLFEIGAVAHQSGLPPATIRAWENRYGAVTPVRSQTGRRLYTMDDARRLTLLRQLVEADHRIGQIAGLATEGLRELAGTLGGTPSARTHITLPVADRPLDGALQATLALDGAALQGDFDQASVALGRIAFIDRYLVPLMHAIGELYQQGRLRAVHEHFATVTVRAYTERLDAAIPAGEGDPLVVVTTPVGQLHELGSVLVALSARLERWRATYLGPNLPAEEIVAALLDTGARHLALGISYPAENGRMAAELDKLLRLLPDDATLFLGGPSSEPYAEALDDARVHHVATLADFRVALLEVREASVLRRDRA